MREALTEKLLVLGVDGMDPRLTKKFLDEGKLANIKAYIDRGACREDLVMLGAQPTVTPPMWTTLATGAYPVTHGITDFYRQSPHELDMICYNLDSRLCQAEQIWNCFAEAGKKTLVWHWPGAAWPPSSDSPNLLVVDGSSPGTVNQARGQLEQDFLVAASESIQSVTFINDVAEGVSAPCVITDLEIPESKSGFDTAEAYTAMEMKTILTDIWQGSLDALLRNPMSIAQSPLKPASGWVAAPPEAKEFVMLLSKGYIRRPCLMLKNEAGIYDRVAIYKSKKETNPIAVLHEGVYEREIIDEAVKNDVHYKSNRDMRILEIDHAGKFVKIWVSATMNAEFDEMFHPQSLFKTITEHIGFPPPSCFLDGSNEQLVTEVMLQGWYHVADWQAASLNYMIENEGVEVIFSHYHNVDLQEHKLLPFLHDKGYNKLPESFYEQAVEAIYQQTDYYLGKFLHLLDEGWSIIITSDHGLVSSSHFPPGIGDMLGVNVSLMETLGFTVLKRDSEGNKLPEIDWTQTKAIATRSLHIYLNLKGRYPHGIIEPKDQFAVEEEIMTALYGYKHPETGQRVVAMALRNKDAVLLGVGGPEAGDIICWTAEGYNYEHADSLSTTYGEGQTSVSPIFIAAGRGIKAGYRTKRIIREVDVAPTAAVLGGVRIPAQCEGAPVYQIFTEEF